MRVVGAESEGRSGAGLGRSRSPCGAQAVDDGCRGEAGVGYGDESGQADGAADLLEGGGGALFVASDPAGRRG